MCIRDSRNSKNFKDTEGLTVTKKSARNLIEYFRIQNRCFLRFWGWRCRRFRTNRRNKFACSKISSSMSATLFALIFPRAERASTFDISAERSVWLQSALRSFAIVCDYMETALFAIVCDPQSSAIIWKPAFSHVPFYSPRNWAVLPSTVFEKSHIVYLLDLGIYISYFERGVGVCLNCLLEVP